MPYEMALKRMFVMKYLFLQYPRCSTCVKARKWLEDRGVEIESRDIVSQRPSAAELSEWIERSGLPVRKFFNVSGARYRELNLKDRIGSLSDDELVGLLASDGMLVKRPLLVGPDSVSVGFREAEWNDLLSR